VVRWQRLLITVVMTMTMATPPMPVQPHLQFGIGAILIRGITPRYPNARFRGDKWFSSGRGIPNQSAGGAKARRVLQSPRPAPMPRTRNSSPPRQRDLRWCRSAAMPGKKNRQQRNKLSASTTCPASLNNSTRTSLRKSFSSTSAPGPPLRRQTLFDQFRRPSLDSCRVLADLGRLGQVAQAK
jgi:hypothetical protein